MKRFIAILLSTSLIATSAAYAEDSATIQPPTTNKADVVLQQLASNDKGNMEAPKMENKAKHHRAKHQRHHHEKHRRHHK